MNNNEVVTSFLTRSQGYNNNLLSDGIRLYSYAMMIARWQGDTLMIVSKGECPSMTTTKHRNLVTREAKALGRNYKEVSEL